MSMAQTVTGWLTGGARTRSAGVVDANAPYTLVTLPDGQLMQVRKNSLAAAKDYLAARNAIERRMRAEREQRFLGEVSGITRAAEGTGVR